MYRDVKEMRESFFGRQTAGFGKFEKPTQEMALGDSVRRPTKRVEVEGVGKAEGVTCASSKLPKLGAAAT